MLTNREARLIAGNPDGVGREDLHELAVWLGHGVRPIRQARVLFPHRPKAYVTTTCQIRNYCWNAHTARTLRAKGDICGAMVYENIADRIYNSLPEYAKW